MCDIQPKSNAELYESIVISKDVSAKPTLESQSSRDTLNDHVYEDMEILSTLIYDLHIRHVVSLSHL